MADVRRLTALGMAPELASETASQIEGAVSENTAVAALTAIATADATDPTTTMALVNICKAKINTIITALKS